MATSIAPPRTVDEYVAGFAPEVQEMLQRVRAAARAGAPDAVEIISYRMPALKQRGVLVYFAAFRQHIGFYPPITGDAKLEARATRYAGEKGNLRFPYAEPIPYDLITALTSVRARQDASKATPRAIGAERVPSPTVYPGSREAWRQWLQAHHASEEGVWLVSYTKASGKPRVEYDVAVEEALCVGWIDSKPAKLDDARTMLWFAPRKPGSGWSRPNKLRVERLVAAGRMTPAGERKIDQAQRDGSWTRLDAVEDLEMPADLGIALASDPEATRHFDAFPRSAKRGILEWIANARTATTRAKRIEETARLANTNQRANQWRPKPAA